MTPREHNDSFLAGLLRKKAAVEEIENETGANVNSALKEVDRQISQCLSGGNPIKGKGVTKSGELD
jgi:hypothetical protein